MAILDESARGSKSMSGVRSQQDSATKSFMWHAEITGRLALVNARKNRSSILGNLTAIGIDLAPWLPVST